MIQIDAVGLQNSEENNDSCTNVENNNDEGTVDKVENSMAEPTDEIQTMQPQSQQQQQSQISIDDDEPNNVKSTAPNINNNNSSNSVKKPNLDKLAEKMISNRKKELVSVNSKMSDLDEKEVNGNDNVGNSDDEMHDEEMEEGDSTAASLAVAQQLMGAAASFNPTMLPGASGMSVQAFQNMVAQFTANAVANNMDMDNVALLKSALFTLQQQQLLQFQLIQHLHSQLMRNNGPERGNDEANEQDRNMSESENEVKKEDDSIIRRLQNCKSMSNMYEYDTPLKRLEEQSARAELDLSSRNNKKSPSRIRDQSDSEKVSSQPELTPQTQINKQATTSTHNSTSQDSHPYQHNFSLASNIITDHDSLPPLNESNSLAMLEKKAQEVLNSASQGILSNNLLDELAFANEKNSPNGRNDPALFKHRCRYCGKIFGSDSSLQIHIRSHTGERPFKCNVCGSRFTTKGNLKVHFQRHTEKYPHIPMNPNPVPEHLDKYFPPLIPQEALKEMPPNGPPSSGPPNPPTGLPPNHISGQFPPRGIFPDFFLPRPPPFDLFNPMAAAAAVELARKPVDLSQVKKPEVASPPPSDVPLSPEVVINEGPKIKEEPEDETLDLSSENKQTNKSPLPLERDDEERIPRSRSRERETRERDRERERDFTLRHSQSTNNHQTDALAKVPSVSPSRSSSSSTSGSLYQDTVLDPAFFPSHLARPDSRDSSWENFIEISSETSKLQELVDNIDNKTTEPNQCLVCKKVLSCRSALQMHYRVHTGERPFRCKICGRSFTTKGNLKTHMSVHRIKPPMRTLHQCPVCHQKFSNIFVLQQHIRLHTGEMTDLTPEQIRAAEIRDYDHPAEHKLHPFGISGRIPEFSHSNHKRMSEHSDDENDADMSEAASPKPLAQQLTPKREGLRPRPPIISPSPGTQAEDLRAMNIHRLSVRSNEELSRDSSPISQASTENAKRMRSSSPGISASPPMPVTRSPIQTPPANDNLTRPPFPYGPPFLAMPHLPPFMNQAPFMRNVPLVPPTAAGMPPFGLFGVRGNTTTCNICFKTFACNSALEIHYRSHTKERPFKCTICDRGFSTKGNMKQHMLTHKIRDMFGNSNSGDESRMSSTSQEPTRPGSKESGQINFAIKLEKSQSPDNYDGEKKESNISSRISENGSPVSYTSAGGNDYQISKDAEIKKWCNKLNEMPENIAAS